MTTTDQKLPTTVIAKRRTADITPAADFTGNQKYAIEVAGGDTEVEVAWTEADSDLFHTLTEKQKQFIIEYLLDFNATRAAKRAGYKVKSDNDASRIGYALLRHPKVGPLTRKASQQTADELGITRGWLLEQVRNLARDAQADGDRVGASRALALLAKLRGDMIDKKEIDMKVVQLNINDVEIGDLR